MKKTLSRTVVIAIGMMFLCSIGFAAEVKTPLNPKTAPDNPTVEKMKVAEKGLIDINSATLEQLKALPGIGDAYAEKIIKERPYLRKDQLKTKKIIPESVYNKISGMIVARKPPKK